MQFNLLDPLLGTFNDPRRLGEELLGRILRGGGRLFVAGCDGAVPCRAALVPEIQFVAGSNLGMHGDDLLD